jgi:hypothetical protein
VLPSRRHSSSLLPHLSSPLSTIHSRDSSESASPHHPQHPPYPPQAPGHPRISPLLTAGQLQKQWSTNTSQLDDPLELESPLFPGSLLSLHAGSNFSVTEGSRSPLASSPVESSLSTLLSSSSLPLATQQSSGGVSSASPPQLTNSSPWPGIWKLITVVSGESPHCLSLFIS